MFVSPKKSQWAELCALFHVPVLDPIAPPSSVNDHRGTTDGERHPVFPGYVWTFSPDMTTYKWRWYWHWQPEED
jgi:hypothetical protein